MMVFGKMTATSEAITDEQSGVRYCVDICRNGDGVDWLDIASQFPHPFFIAVDDNRTIVGFSDQADMIQMGDVEMIGIDTDFGLQGRSALGKKWDGERIIE